VGTGQLGRSSVTSRCRTVRGEIVRVHAVQAYPGSRGIFPLVLNLGTR
jgi:hypothetical protein